MIPPPCDQAPTCLGVTVASTAALLISASITLLNTKKMVTYSLRAFADAAANKSTPKLSKRIRIVRFVTQLRGWSKDGCRNRAGRQFRSLAGIRWKRTRKDESLFCSKSAGHSKHAKRTGAGNPEAGQGSFPSNYVEIINSE